MANRKLTSPLAEASSTNGIDPTKSKKFTVKNKKKDKHPKAQKQAIAPIRLNKRMRRVEREQQEKALAAYAVADTKVKLENLSCNWKLLQQVLDGNVVPKSKNNKKRRRRNSSTVDSDTTNKRSKQDTNADLTSPLKPSAETSNSDTNTDLDKLIDSIKKTELTSGKKNGTEVAWFDNVDPFLLEDDIAAPKSCSMSSAGEESDGDAVEINMDKFDQFFEDAERIIEETKKKNYNAKKAKQMETAVAMDCEMVGVGLGSNDSALARVSIVDRLGNVLYDKYVKPVEAVTDYRTKYSGIRPENLVNATAFAQVQKEVAKLLKGRMLVGHALKNDMRCLMLSHPTHSIRDTSLYQPFRKMYNKFAPSLKNLCQDVLGVTIQEGEHDSVTDARAAMRLYTMHRAAWEEDLSMGGRGHFKNATMSGVKRFKGAPGSRKKNKKRVGGRFARKFSTHGKQK